MGLSFGLHIRFVYRVTQTRLSSGCVHLFKWGGEVHRFPPFRACPCSKEVPHSPRGAQVVCPKSHRSTLPFASEHVKSCEENVV